MSAGSYVAMLKARDEARSSAESEEPTCSKTKTKDYPPVFWQRIGKHGLQPPCLWKGSTNTDRTRRKKVSMAPYDILRKREIKTID